MLLIVGCVVSLSHSCSRRPPSYMYWSDAIVLLPCRTHCRAGGSYTASISRNLILDASIIRTLLMPLMRMTHSFAIVQENETDVVTN